MKDVAIGKNERMNDQETKLVKRRFFHSILAAWNEFLSVTSRIVDKADMNIDGSRIRERIC